MRGNNRVLWVVIIADVLTALVAVMTNLATEVVPEEWRPHLWIAWPVLGVLVVGGIPVAIKLHGNSGDGVRQPVSRDRAAFSRRAMLARLRTVWIEGVLDRSLYRRTLIDLDLDERPDLLKRSWDIVVEHGAEAARQLDRDTALVDVVDRHRGLLVLGAPGAGKTTMLLTFLEDLLDEARRDDVAPIPVVFQLSSWPASGKPLAVWFVEELTGPLYGVPKDLAEDWIRNDRVLPLLDGLDEVALSHRLACARAIDDFHRAHQILPVIVSSRIADYDALGLRLSLDTALLIQPLTRPQTEDYLDRFGEPLAGLREALRGEPSLWELLRTPFLLSVAVRAYHGLPAGDIATEGTLEQRQAELVRTFVDRAFARRKSGPKVETPDAVRMLAYLARALGQELETYFFLEAVGTNWLATSSRRLVVVATAVPTALLSGTAIGLPMGLFFGWPIGLGFGLVSGFVVGAVALLDDAVELRYPWHLTRRSQLADDLEDWAFFGTLTAGIMGLIGGVFGLVGGLVLGVVRLLTGDDRFFGAVFHGGLVGLAGGVLLSFLVTAGTTNPFAGKRNSLRDRPSGSGMGDAVWLCTAYVLLAGVPVAAVLGFFYGVPGIVTGVVVGLAIGYGYSGRGVVAYWLARLLLARAGIVPAHLLRFLDFAVDRTLMLKVGGGYMFAHRLLLEHFAGLEPPGVKESYVRDGLQAVDLRPHVLLERAHAEAQQETGSIMRLLSYTGSVLSADVWAPAALKIAEVLESRVQPEVGQSAAETADLRNAQVDGVIAVYSMVVGSGHQELSAVAALRLGEWVHRALTSGSVQRRAELERPKQEAIKALEAVVASANAQVVSDGATTLALLTSK
ncbi:hypothetical protein AB0E59_11300 [Lentzea sp. NPDC034063]|uniref:NACHT domain-containing protein n=1 Tax=unclassified Lentzea TaxID=2643253 RepID=UPI0033D5F44C